MKRVFFLFIGCIITSTLAPATSWADTAPLVDTPASTMPHPNGYDYFIRAGEAFVRDDKGVDEVTATAYVKGKKYPIAPKEAWLKKNAKAFHLLREGLKFPARQPMRAGSAIFPSYVKFRSLARALTVESHVYIERGKFDKAANSVLDIIDFGYDIPRGGTLIASLVGNAIQAIGAHEWGDLMLHLDAKTSQAAASRLEKIYDGRFPYYKTLQEEKLSTQHSLRGILKQRDWRKEMVNDWNLPVIQSVPLLFLSKDDVMGEYSKLMDVQIDKAHLPYGKMQSLLTKEESPLASLVSDATSYRWIQGRENTKNVLIMTMLALRAYKLHHGNYPINLQQLVPNYLRKVPIDPFDGMTTLRYRLEKEKYRLWSIGPDGVDNNGRPIENKNRTGRARYRSWASGDNGDVVAGINAP